MKLLQAQPRHVRGRGDALGPHHSLQRPYLPDHGLEDVPRHARAARTQRQQTRAEELELGQEQVVNYHRPQQPILLALHRRAQSNTSVSSPPHHPASPRKTQKSPPKSKPPQLGTPRIRSTQLHIHQSEPPEPRSVRNRATLNGAISNQSREW